MVAAIAFVSEEDVDDTWRLLKPLLVLPPDMIEFTRYYEAIWIGSYDNRPTFAHDMWNQKAAGRSLLPRSTNIVKCWYWGFNSMLGCSNPTIWKFLDCVKAEQSLTDMKKKTKQIMTERPQQSVDRSKLGLQSALLRESYYTLMRLINKLGLQS